jgi:hypothetical protein
LATRAKQVEMNTKKTIRSTDYKTLQADTFEVLIDPSPRQPLLGPKVDPVIGLKVDYAYGLRVCERASRVHAADTVSGGAGNVYGVRPMTDSDSLIFSDRFRSPVTAQRRESGGVVLRSHKSWIALSDSELERLFSFVRGLGQQPSCPHSDELTAPR